jgi:hypothetical protein
LYHHILNHSCILSCVRLFEYFWIVCGQAYLLSHGCPIHAALLLHMHCNHLETTCTARRASSIASSEFIRRGRASIFCLHSPPPSAEPRLLPGNSFCREFTAERVDVRLTLFSYSLFYWRSCACRMVQEWSTGSRCCTVHVTQRVCRV